RLGVLRRAAYDPFSVADVVAPTTRVATVKDAVADPPGTVTLAGTVRGSPADSATSAPPAGAAPISVTPPTMEPPPTTFWALNEIAEMATLAVTLSIGDRTLAPSSVAVISAAPLARAVTVKVPLDAPA